MKHSVRKYLEDIRLSILDIESYTANIQKVEEIENNLMLFDALCRRFSIIGEALYQLDKINPGLQITDKTKIKSLRHIIVHDYDVVRAFDLFIIIRKKLPLLNDEILLLLTRLEE